MADWEDGYNAGVTAERERCAKIAISFGEFPGDRLTKELRTMCGNVIAEKIREASAIPQAQRDDAT